MHQRLLHIPNRSLLYDLYPYIWDIEGIISMVGSYVKWLGMSNWSFDSTLDPLKVCLQVMKASTILDYSVFDAFPLDLI